MYTLPTLPYAYDALQPYISEEIMKLHHMKHHQSYVDKLNVALEQAPEFKAYSLVELLSHIDRLPDAVRTIVRNNGGGHYNHSLFWQCMSPDMGGRPDGILADAIERKWGDFESFVNDFNARAAGLFGSGWTWLMPDLELMTLPNQDTPMALGKGEPLMGLDVWEHAYYLDYKNDRHAYIVQWWNIVNWRFIEDRYDQVREK